MKLLLGVVLCVSIGLSVGLPARDLSDDAEIVIVPKGQQGVAAKTEDSDEDFFKNPSFPFPQPSFGFNIGFSDSFSDIFRRFHTRFNPWGATDSKENGDDAVAFPAFGLPIPEGGNTTHTVQVVDGHKVEINNTVYEKKGDFGSSVFKVRIINVRPLESGEEPDVGTRAPGSTAAPPKTTESTRESTEDKDEESNDINSNFQPESTTITPIAQPNESTITPMVDDSIETTTVNIDTQDSTTPLIKSSSTSSFASSNDDADSDNEGDNDKLSMEAPESSESINNNYGKNESEFEYENRYDSAVATPLHNRKLEKLEYINKAQHPLQDEFSADIETDEEADNNDSSNNNHNSEWNSVERVADNNIYANDIDLYAPESVPVDLSNDIAVNDMFADQGFVDPDAEVFDVNDFPGDGGLHKPFAKLHIYEPIKRK